MLPNCWSSLSLETTISESTSARKLSNPTFALSIRLVPSKAKGVVTIPIVSAPSPLATLAITGDAPVPVPLPYPMQ